MQGRGESGVAGECFAVGAEPAGVFGLGQESGLAAVGGSEAPSSLPSYYAGRKLFAVTVGEVVCVKARGRSRGHGGSLAKDASAGGPGAGRKGKSEVPPPPRGVIAPSSRWGWGGRTEVRVPRQVKGQAKPPAVKRILLGPSSRAWEVMFGVQSQCRCKSLEKPFRLFSDKTFFGRHDTTPKHHSPWRLFGARRTQISVRDGSL